MKYYRNKETGEIVVSLFVNKKNRDQFELISGTEHIELNVDMIEEHLYKIHTRLGWIVALIAIPFIIGIIALALTWSEIGS